MAIKMGNMNRRNFLLWVFSLGILLSIIKVIIYYALPVIYLQASLWVVFIGSALLCYIFYHRLHFLNINKFFSLTPLLNIVSDGRVFLAAGLEINSFSNQYVFPVVNILLIVSLLLLIFLEKNR